MCVFLGSLLTVSLTAHLSPPRMSFFRHTEYHAFGQVHMLISLNYSFTLPRSFSPSLSLLGDLSQFSPLMSTCQTHPQDVASLRSPICSFQYASVTIYFSHFSNSPSHLLLYGPYLILFSPPRYPAQYAEHSVCCVYM